MDESTNQPPECDPPGTTQINSHQSTEGSRVGINRATSNGYQTNVSKKFDGSLYFRQSNVMLNGKHRGERSFDEPQRNSYHELTTRSLSHVQTKPPTIVVSSKLSTHKSSEAERTVNSNDRVIENAGYMKRLKRSFPTNGSHASSNSQETMYDKFLQRSRETLQKKEIHDDEGHKKEHSPKSVSFASSVKSVDKPSKSTLPGKGEGGNGRRGTTRNFSATPRAHKVQSNVVLREGIGQTFTGSVVQNGEMRKSLHQKPMQQTATMERKYCDASEENIPLPPSPPTRDTNGAPEKQNSHSGSVQVLSLYDEKNLFTSSLSRSSGSFPRQSNVNLTYDGSKTLGSSMGSSFAPKRGQIVPQSNSKVDFSLSSSLRSSRDARLTVEELLSSGSVNSSPETSPPTKFAPQFGRNSSSSKKEHSLDDFDDEQGSLQDLRYGVHFVSNLCFLLVILLFIFNTFEIWTA